MMRGDSTLGSVWCFIKRNTVLVIYTYITLYIIHMYSFLMTTAIVNKIA